MYHIRSLLQQQSLFTVAAHMGTVYRAQAILDKAYSSCLKQKF